MTLLGASFAQAKNTPKTTTKVGMQAMVNAYIKSRTGGTFKITKKDLRNGYMKYKSSYTNNMLNFGEFGYYITSTGMEMLAVTTTFCMQSCGTGLEFFVYRNNKIQALNQQIVGMIDMPTFQNKLNKHVEATMSQKEKASRARGDMGLFSVYIKLPQHGTTILVEKDSRVDNKTSVVAELRYNYNTGRFTFVKK